MIYIPCFRLTNPKPYTYPQMNFLHSMTFAAALTGIGMANTEPGDDAIAYHAVSNPAMGISLPAHAATALPITVPPLRDPMPAANITPAVTAVITTPGNNSWLESTTAMIGTIGMLILVFRRRADTA